jgi:hypothetical protein
MIDVRQIAVAVIDGDKLQESARAIEELPDAARRQAGAMPWNIEVEPCVEKLSQHAHDTRIFDPVKVRGDVAHARVLAEYG